MFDDDDGRLYRAVRNSEEQYSIWPADREPPPGWAGAGEPGTKAECLTVIDRLWTDMRPRSLRARSDDAP
jgi:MbtH protein